MLQDPGRPGPQLPDSGRLGAEQVPTDVQLPDALLQGLGFSLAKKANSSVLEDKRALYTTYLVELSLVRAPAPARAPEWAEALVVHGARAAQVGGCMQMAEPHQSNRAAPPAHARRDLWLTASRSSCDQGLGEARAVGCRWTTHA